MFCEYAHLAHGTSFGHTWISNSRISIFRSLKGHEAKAIRYVEAASILKTETIVVDYDDVRARIASCEPAQTPIFYRLVDDTKARKRPESIAKVSTKTFCRWRQAWRRHLHGLPLIRQRGRDFLVFKEFWVRRRDAC